MNTYAEHVHDCTGPDMTCSCGFVFRVERFLVSFHIWDNKTKRELVSDGFNCGRLSVAIDALRKAADSLERMRLDGRL